VPKNSRSKRDKEEVQQFRRFVEHSNLAVVARSIEKRFPPEPDIFCRLEDGTNLAFELVEICHRHNARFFGSAPLIARALERSYRDLPRDLRDRFTERFANRPLSFTFAHSASLNRIRQILQQLFIELVERPEKDRKFCTFSKAVQETVISVRLSGRVDVHGRPSFNIAGSFAPDDVVIDCVRPKLSRKYKTPHPIELLAYFDGRAWGRSTSWQGSLKSLLDAVGTGPFRRVWVLGWESVDFVYPSELPVGAR